jgi:hypothetical protein
MRIPAARIAVTFLELVLTVQAQERKESSAPADPLLLLDGSSGGAQDDPGNAGSGREFKRRLPLVEHVHRSAR